MMSVQQLNDDENESALLARTRTVRYKLDVVEERTNRSHLLCWMRHQMLLDAWQRLLI